MQQIHRILGCCLWLIAAHSALGQQPPGAMTRVYHVDPSTLPSLTEELRKAFAGDPSIRVAAEPQTGRLVIVAPEAVHAGLREIMTESRPARNGPPLPNGAAMDAREPGRSSPSVMVRLSNRSAAQMRANLWQLWGGNIPSQRSPDGKSEVLSLGENNPARLTINYAANEIRIEGSAHVVPAWARLIALLDKPPVTRDERTELVSVKEKPSDSLQRVVRLIQQRANQSQLGQSRQRTDVVQWNKEKTQPIRRDSLELAQAPAESRAQAPSNPPAATDRLGENPNGEGLLGPVQIEYLDGLDVIVLKGKKEDVERVTAIIQEIENLSIVTEPSIEVVDLQHVDSQAMAELIQPLYEEVLSVRQGRVSITALVKPNAILLVGRPESVKVVQELIAKLDRPVQPETEFHVFQLQYLSAAEAEETINEFYEERGGLGAKVRVVSDFRSNSVILQASPRDAEEVRKLLASLDVGKAAAVNEVRVFRLKNSLAEDLVPVLEGALQGEAAGGPAGEAAATGQPATTLSLTTVDAEGKQQFQSGVLADVEVTADPRGNAIVVRGPAESMSLIQALIEQLDLLPAEDARIKVFTIVNGDAIRLAEVLDQLFGSQVGGGQGGELNGSAQNPLIPLRFSVDERTNSIVASGSGADLRVVEAILLRLDEEDVTQRQSIVFRLRYAPAIEVAAAINQFLQNERQIQDVAPNAISPFEQIEREVVVVAEPVSNSLIVSATPRYFDEIYRIVQELDARPPMVMIQVLIAEVQLDRFYELGVELGVQDPLLFDRSVLTDVITPGFNFNNQPLGNANNASSFLSAGTVGSQALGSFGLGRLNNQFGFGGLVLSASSDALSVLLRALEVDSRAEILSRPQVMTLDNQLAFVQVGQRVPRITSSQLTVNGTINNTVLENVGILLQVLPRISPDGLVVMQINAEKSELGPVDDGIPISISANGDVIRSPIIFITTAQTTVSARSGQTVILGGLITENSRTFLRGVPYLSNVPILGDLFRYEQEADERKELLIIMTPYIVRGDNDVNCVNQIEAERMSWCLSDVYRVHGQFNVKSCNENFPNDNGATNGISGDVGCEPTTIYPDRDPTGSAYQNFEASPLESPGVAPHDGPSSEPLPRPMNTQAPHGYPSAGTQNWFPSAHPQSLVPVVPPRDPSGTRPYVVQMQPIASPTTVETTRDSQWSPQP